jgi:hypothetical protein
VNIDQNNVFPLLILKRVYDGVCDLICTQLSTPRNLLLIFIQKILPDKWKRGQYTVLRSFRQQVAAIQVDLIDGHFPDVERV